MHLSFAALVGIFLSGLALNLTPCVYPMLSVTVALFSAKGGSASGGGGGGHRYWPSAFGKALLYVSGMALMYSMLGLFAAFTGGFFGAALQNQWVLLGMV